MALTLSTGGQGGVFTLRGGSFGGRLQASVTPTPTLLLDLYPTAAAAYSLRKLRSTYTGSCIQVRRNNDGATLDIGFINNVLDTTTLLTFAGVNTCSILKWYDQSGNGNTAFNATVNSLFPQIVASGVLVTQNSKASINFTQNPLQFTTSISSGVNTSSYIIGKSNSLTSAGPLIGNTGAGPYVGQYFNQLLIQSGNTTTLDVLLTATNSANTNFNINNLYYTSSPRIYVNNTLIPITSSSTFAATRNTFELIGNYAGVALTVGFISEVIIYKSDQLSNRTGINANINSFYNIYTPTWSGTGTALLDLYPSAAAAYSLRNLSSTYLGPLIRVRRSSDNTEQDFYGLTNGQLDTTALLAFCGAGNGFVTTWYDQSGNATNSTQSTAGNQPQIISSGTVILLNSKPSALFNGSTQFMSTSTSPFNSTQTTIIGISKQTAIANYYKRLVSIGAYNSGYYLGSNTAQDDMLVVFNGSALTCFGGTSMNQNLTIAYNNATTGFLNNNGTQVGSITTTVASYGNQKFFIASDSVDNGQEYWNGNIQEIIVYPTNQSANITGLQTNINSYYSIY